MNEFEGANIALEQEMSELVQASYGLMRVIREIRHSQGVTNAVALEAERLMPGEFFNDDRQLKNFTAFPEYKHYVPALEAVSAAMIEAVLKIVKFIHEQIMKFIEYVQARKKKTNVERDERAAEVFKEPQQFMTMKTAVLTSVKMMAQPEEIARQVQTILKREEPNNPGLDMVGMNVKEAILRQVQRMDRAAEQLEAPRSTSTQWLYLLMSKEHPPLPYLRVGDFVEATGKIIQQQARELWTTNGVLNSEESFDGRIKLFMQKLEQSQRKIAGAPLNELLAAMQAQKEANYHFDWRAQMPQLMEAYGSLIGEIANFRYQSYLEKLVVQMKEWVPTYIADSIKRQGNQSVGESHFKVSFLRVVEREVSSTLKLLNLYLAKNDSLDLARTMNRSCLDVAGAIWHAILNSKFSEKSVRAVSRELLLSPIIMQRKLDIF